ncbi:MAG: NADH:flavin oxidoreductase [Spirochaetales bacterium]|nr:NADH:flavin oxidoreductase [Spirochaetales bacterium]
MRLFEETDFAGGTLKNRFVRASVWMAGADEKGHLTQELLDHYKMLATGGAGLILTGYAYISDEEQPNPGMLGIYDDSFIEEYRTLTDAVHREGAKIALQIVFGGSQSHHPDAGSMNILAPSSIENRVTGLMPKEATRDDIKRIVRLFGDAAYRAREAGFDGVQIHGAHGYFLSSFLTPFYNKREDEYNGDIHDRGRILYEVYEEVRSRVGADFPIIYKINWSDFMDTGEGLEFNDALQVFRELDRRGVDLFEVSAVNESSGKGMAPARKGIHSREKESYFREATAKIAKSVDAPVILMGGNRSVDVMEEILNNTDIEYFSLGRPLLCETDLVNKWEQNSEYKPKCISCNQCWTTTPNSCILNR